MELTIASNTMNISDPWTFYKEISSDGNVCSLDSMYHLLPLMKAIAPKYIERVLKPLLAYLETGGWRHPWAVHDIGSRKCTIQFILSRPTRASRFSSPHRTHSAFFRLPKRHRSQQWPSRANARPRLRHPHHLHLHLATHLQQHPTRFTAPSTPPGLRRLYLPQWPLHRLAAEHR